MKLKNVIRFCMISLYLYTLAFGIFMTDFFRIPTPIISGLLLLLFVKKPFLGFAYYQECIIFSIALFLYNVVGMGDYKSFFANLVTIVIAACYFNYVVGLEKKQYKISIILFYAWLFVSLSFMILDHNYQTLIDPIRSALLGEQVKQSPSGLAVTQFTFGYQLAAFTVFTVVISFTVRLHPFIKILVFGYCILSLYLGMNRSAFVSFVSTVAAFLIIYYRFKAVIIIAAGILICMAIYPYALKDDVDSKNNILAKNSDKKANDYNRANMAEENFKIYADYPYGLIFYGKSWEDVTYRNPLFTFGLSSHNAYLMFITYMGPFLGVAFFVAIYKRISGLFISIIKNIKIKGNALLLALFFSFLAVSINALSHNAWLFGADGPTLFLYFAILQGAKIYIPQNTSFSIAKVPLQMQEYVI